MDRTEYINRMSRALYCISHKTKIPQDALVEYEGTRYYPLEYIMTSDGDGNLVHCVLIHSLTAHATTRTLLEKVKEITNDTN